MVTLWKLIKESRGNAIWDGIKFLWNHGGKVFAIAVLLISTGAAMVRQLPLSILGLFVFVCSFLSYPLFATIRLVLWRRRIKRESGSYSISDNARPWQFSNRARARIAFDGSQQEPQPQDTSTDINICCVTSYNVVATVNEQFQQRLFTKSFVILFIVFAQPLNLNEVDFHFTINMNPRPVVTLRKLFPMSAMVAVESDLSAIPAGMIELLFQQRE